MDERQFRDAMGKFTTGITIVSVDYKDEVFAMTVNAFMSISLNPRLIAISIAEKASMYPKLLEAKRFGLSVLKEEQKDISMIFAKQKEKDRQIPFSQLQQNPIIENALAMLSCTVVDTHKAGDHVIFIAEVEDLKTNNGSPLLYYGGKYEQINKA
ncbi:MULTISPECIES: flavin reductase family protein [unclassified Virgibacillus]|uniref:flavin reductase family protein n=1 Tax=unclassified Virgibacillus TaxID=2620237 RepID=UPI0024DEC552|nr:flavin reductase family protein [Virgibacillus sp. LDC-1]